MFKVQLVPPGRDGDHALRCSSQLRARRRHHCIVPVRRDGCNLLLDTAEEALCGPKLHPRNNFARRTPGEPFIQHGPRGAATMVPDSIQVHHLEHPRSVAPRVDEIVGQPHWVQVLVAIAVRKVGEHFASIGCFPPEKLEGQRIRFIPRHLLRDKVVHAGLLIDLRQLPVIAERIRIPSYAGSYSVQPLQLPLPDQQLADQGFSARHVQVRFHPHATDDFPTSLLNAALDLRVHLRIFIRDPLVVLRCRLCVGKCRVLFHQLQHRAKGAAHHIDGLCPRP